MLDNLGALDRKLLFAAKLGALLLALGCSGGDGPMLPRPGPGVIFTYPHDGQIDVPVGARIVVSFTNPVNEVALAAGCTGGAGGEVTGAFCVIGPDGPIANTAAIAGEDNNVIHVQSDQLVPGATYQVYARPEIVSGSANNLPASGPLFSFRTRMSDIRPGELPTLVSVNGEDPAVFAIPSAGVVPRFPMLDFTTVRLLLSEPIDSMSVVAGASVRLVEVAGGAETDVPGLLLAQGIHISFDPDVDLRPGAAYRLRLDGIRDLGGEAMAPVELELVPQDARTDGMLIEQVMNAEPAAGDGTFPVVSPRTGAELNSLAVSSQLIGETTIHLADATLRAEMGNPSRFGKRIPLTIRKGQRLATTSLDVRLGGLIPAGLSTGDIEVRFISDAVGWLTRSPYRAEDVLPDDQEAPLYLYLSMDLAVTARDATGNAVLNQTVLGAQATGVAYAADGALAIEGAGALELDLLGVATAPANMVLGLRTTERGTAAPQDTEGPVLQMVSPAEGQTNVAPRQTMRIVLSEAVTIGPTSIRLASGAAPTVPLAADIVVRGSTIEVTPRAPLAGNSNYVLALEDGITDMAGNPLVFLATDPSSGDGNINFRTVFLGGEQTAPLLTMVYPGAPCALQGASGQAPGRCTDGEDNDSSYLPFELPAHRMIEAYFDQPINPATLTLGQSCNTGSVRVEQRSGPGGPCQSVVPGILMPHTYGFRFLPAQPWAPGQSYALTLIGGGNDTCSAGEICGVNGQPLNTDPLNATSGTEGGGPNLVMPFTGTPAIRDTYLLTGTAAYSDTNGNGVLDAQETPRPGNRAALKITGTSGIISSAAIAGNDCIPETQDKEGCTYLRAELPVSLADPQMSCTIGQDASGNPIVVDTCIPLRIYPVIIYGTSLEVNAVADLLFDINLTVNTGRIALRIRETAPAMGYIIQGEGGQPTLITQLDAYMDAPDMRILGGTASHDLRSKKVTMSMAGPVSFTEDGRIRIELTNTAPVDVTVGIEIINIDAGSMTMQIPEGGISLELLGYRQTRQ